MPDSSPIRKTWSELTVDEFYDIARVRTEVFYLEQRIDDIEHGKVELLDTDEVFANIRAGLAARRK